MNVDSFEFLNSLPQEQYTTHNGKPIQIRELIRLTYPEKIKKTAAKRLTRQKKKGK